MLEVISAPTELSRSERATSDRRLLKLAAVLRELPPRRFQYAYWVGSSWKGDPNLSCGTTACALGWATTIPSLRRLGLHLVHRSWGEHTVALKRFPSATGEEAGARIFRLTHSESMYIFIPGTFYSGKTSPNRNAGPKTVAGHIEQFVRDRDKLFVHSYP